MNTQNIFSIISLVHTFLNVKRDIKVNSQLENDVEHSYKLAMVCWYLNDSLQLKLNTELILKYSLTHESLKHIHSEFSFFSGMLASIESYESKANEEARFVFFVDKMIADLTTYVSDSRYYLDRKISFEEWHNWFTKKIAKAYPEYNEIEFVAAFIDFVKSHPEHYYTT